MDRKENEKLIGKQEKPRNMRNCMRCGMMFQYNGSGHIICPRCREEDKRDFDRVRDYVYEHKGATIIEVAEALDIKPEIIEGFLRAGRLEIPNDSAVFIHCERCRKEIKSGRFCANCAAQLTMEMKRALDFDDSQIGEEPDRKGKMHFIGHREL
ncbi:hypothetical protein [Acetivibrio ethanolgignens]|uniref:MerR family transcriptional regulator n=1 Tax=Acetivibrio ethanolgignens TaxID=290052 RepID=A0A0V8QJ56_9FIRM|nr:hypothetical protein [Acetivibrio ethanolgignens]KSV60607.1 hypothetical protein ASU35_00060 [Acetivibrio ethanolgignens]